MWCSVGINGCGVGINGCDESSMLVYGLKFEAIPLSFFKFL